MENRLIDLNIQEKKHVEIYVVPEIDFYDNSL